MRPSAWQLVAVCSLLVATAARTETRPQYGGTLRVMMRITPATLDPADRAQPDSLPRRNLTRLMFDTLVSMDNVGRIQPALATSWQAESGNQRWQFWLRRNVKFHDGTPLTAEVAAASLRAANPTWRVYGSGDSITIECDTPGMNLPAELTLARNAIAKRTPAAILGTGPFHVADWQTGKRLTLAAEEAYWGGRAFVDSISIEMGRNYHDQMIALELGKADVVEVAPEQIHRANLEDRHAVVSEPLELVALVFAKDQQSAEDGRVRAALSLSIDRTAIRNVVLQGQGEVTGGMLPIWMGGYEFVFPTDFNLPRAQQTRGEARQASPWTLGYDSADPVMRLVAERIALNARDAGITLQPTASPATDVRVVLATLPSAEPRLALSTLATRLGLPQPRFEGKAEEDLFRAESGLLESRRIIPLFYLPAAYAIRAPVKDFRLETTGEWRLADVWLGTEKP
jgi:peptide/nickel transport system substrate-binding protein